MTARRAVQFGIRNCQILDDLIRELGIVIRIIINLNIFLFLLNFFVKTENYIYLPTTLQQKENGSTKWQAK